jgi:menaquinone-dependent protoporphyrinogen IX oxidase
MALSKLTKYVKQLGSKSGVIFSLGPLADDQHKWKTGNSPVWIKIVARKWKFTISIFFIKDVSKNSYSLTQNRIAN